MDILKWLAVAGSMMFSMLAHGEPGIDDKNILIGMSAPLSGPIGGYGKQMQYAIQAGFEQINQAGGINGRKLQLLALDDAYDSNRSVSNTRRLVDDHKVFALVGYYGSNPTIDAMNQAFGPARVPLVGTISGADPLREAFTINPNARYLFNTRASYADETNAIIRQLVSLGLKRIGVLYHNDNFGRSGLDGVSQALKQHQLELTIAAAIDRQNPDLSAAVGKIAGASVQAVVLVALHKPAVSFIQAMKKAGQYPMFVTLSPIGTEQFIAELGKDARGVVISQVVPHLWNDTLPIVRDYRRLVGDEKASYHGLEAYLMTRTLLEGLKRAGKDLTREKLISALESLNHFDLGGYRIDYGNKHRTGSRFVELTVVGPDGKILR